MNACKQNMRTHIPRTQRSMNKEEKLNAQAQALQKQAERVRRISYLKGKTPKCTNCNKNRVTLAGGTLAGGTLAGGTLAEDLLCYACQEKAKTADLDAELKKPNDNWYIYWEPYNACVCRECRTEIAADENNEPAIACCPNTYNCPPAIDYWGKDNAEPQHYLDLFVLDRKKQGGN